MLPGAGGGVIYVTYLGPVVCDDGNVLLTGPWEKELEYGDTHRRGSLWYGLRCSRPLASGEASVQACAVHGNG